MSNCIFKCRDCMELIGRDWNEYQYYGVGRCDSCNIHRGLACIRKELWKWNKCMVDGTSNEVREFLGVCCGARVTSVYTNKISYHCRLCDSVWRFTKTKQVEVCKCTCDKPISGLLMNQTIIDDGFNKPDPKPLTIKKAIKYLRKHPEVDSITLIGMKYNDRSPSDVLFEYSSEHNRFMTDYICGYDFQPIYKTVYTNKLKISLIKESKK